MSDEARIREQAHAIWEREGRPDGRHEAHWARAAEEIAAQGRAAQGKAAQGRAAQGAAGGDTGSPAARKPARAGAGKKETTRDKAPAVSAPDGEAGTAASPAAGKAAGPPAGRKGRATKRD